MGTIRKFEAQKRISTLWFIGLGFFFLVIVVQILLSRYGNYNKDVVEWSAQNSVPVLMIILGSCVANINQRKSTKTVDLFYFRLTFYISLFYLIVLCFVLLFYPIGVQYNKSLVTYFKSSQLFLTVIQGLTLYALGMFFNKEN